MIEPLLNRLYFNDKLTFCYFCDQLLTYSNTNQMIDKILKGVRYIKMLDTYMHYNNIHINKNEYFMEKYEKKKREYEKIPKNKRGKIHLKYLRDYIKYMH